MRIKAITDNIRPAPVFERIEMLAQRMAGDGRGRIQGTKLLIRRSAVKEISKAIGENVCRENQRIIARGYETGFSNLDLQFHLKRHDGTYMHSTAHNRPRVRIKVNCQSAHKIDPRSASNVDPLFEGHG